ncbi:coiled-coil domain-containing protein [Planoprotostelium fungivorum]|uniref:Coiled-coil domain-containing protein n=1 Tax=Planoprotostelium fungivorum TaxID=1890364 RepID=A0A2P6N8Z7_9EUKA|nr:coiled-coil domain-containing protein [Planoprotostelium fungivorum]
MPIAGDEVTFLTQRAKLPKDWQDGIFEEEFLEEGQESLSTLLIKKSQESNELQEMLKQARVNYFQRIKKCEFQEKELGERRIEYENHKAKFERFMNDNEQQRNRAVRRAHEEQKEGEKMEEEIVKLKIEIDELRTRTKICLSSLRDNRRFEKLLEKVVVASQDTFESVADLLARYDTLSMITTDLQNSVKSNETGVDQLRHTIGQAAKAYQNETLVLNSSITQLKHLYEQARSGYSLTEQNAYESELSHKMKNSEIGEVKLAVTNIYARSKQKFVNSSKIALISKLDRIGTQLATMQEILKEYDKTIHRQQQEAKKPITNGKK